MKKPSLQDPHLLFPLAVRGANSEVFTKVYKNRIWGGAEDFYSGPGSRDSYIVKPYIAAVIDFLRSYGKNNPAIVDLGCGDFNIGKHFIKYCSSYSAVDVVPSLIKKLRSSGYPDKVKFSCRDIVHDTLPDGDICFMRQVFQHLSNRQIKKVLPKFKKYKVVFVTEHYPLHNPHIIPNTDNTSGHFSRLYFGSGVYLDKYPFNIPSSQLTLFLEVPCRNPHQLRDPGIIRTYKLERPSRRA